MNLAAASSVFALATSPDGTSFAFGERGTVTLCEISGVVRWTHRFRGRSATPVTALAYSRDGSSLLAAGKSIALLDTATGSARSTTKVHRRSVNGVCALENGFLSWSGESINPPDNTVRRIDLSGDDEVLVEMNHPVAAASHVDERLVSVDQRGNVLADGETHALQGLRHAETIRAVCIHDEHVLVGRGISLQRYALSGELLASVDVVDLDRLVTELLDQPGAGDSDEAARASAAEYIVKRGAIHAVLPNTDEVVVATDHGVSVVDLEDGTARAVWDEATAGCLALVPGGVLASGAGAIHQISLD